MSAYADIDLHTLLKLLLSDVDSSHLHRMYDWNVIQIAAFKGDVQAVTRILALDPLALIDTRAGLTALHIAVEEGHQNVVMTLLEVCPSLIDDITTDGWSTLHIAARKGHDTLVALLLSTKPELINAVTNDGFTALHCAADGGHSAALARLLLVANSGLIEAVTRTRWTVLHCAAFKGHGHVVTQLLTAKPTLVNAVTDGGWTALHWAANNGHDQVVAQLLAASPSSINYLSGSGRTPLYYAACGGRNKVIALLLDSGLANPDNDWAALQVAAIHQYDSTVLTFLNHKPALAHKTDQWGNTVFHLAAQSESKDYIEEVWKLKPDAVRALNTNGETPFQLLVQTQKEHAIDLLQWSMTFDEVVSAYVFCKNPRWVDRLQPVLEAQCEPLNVLLLPDVASTVFEYLGLKRPQQKK